MVIPAHPLALTASRRLDERRQRALTRYYLDAGAGGVAVGVHTTQFAIRHPGFALYRPVLALAAETVAEWEGRRRASVLRVAGLVGKTRQALGEARVAHDLGYHLGLLSLGALFRATEAELIAHCRAVAEVIPLMGFYLQPSVGGRELSYRFWRRFVEIENVVGIKIAPFNRYATLDVIRAVADAGREREVALYTGNDDNIVADLLIRYRVRRRRRDGYATLRMAGGLLGHWAYWTRSAVSLLDRVRWPGRREPLADLLRLGVETTDANGAIFDAANHFRGCIPGIHEILRRRGLLRGRWCLDPGEELSPGQMAEIDRVLAAYPHLADDEFVKANLDRWLA
ncbi:MAG: dihydrodipicolinate synthase/N-acetylneuraminate lyase [Gemmatimonadetes bacterium]|nr:dihydrodipicolinate synthase/N-acetylneuraminate lyase [Gemmatimonadota bacterium]